MNLHPYGNKEDLPIEDDYDDDNVPEIDLPQGSRYDIVKNIFKNDGWEED